MGIDFRRNNYSISSRKERECCARSRSTPRSIRPRPSTDSRSTRSTASASCARTRAKKDIKVGSTVGTGDSVVAALERAETPGVPFDKTARLAVATGSANVMCSETQAAELEAIEGLLDQVTIEELCQHSPTNHLRKDSS